MRISVPLLIGLTAACTKTPPAESPQIQSASASETTITQSGPSTTEPERRALQTGSNADTPRANAEPESATRAMARDNTAATTATAPNARSSQASTEPSPATPSSPPTDADNTRANERDRDSNSLTPVDQSNSRNDLKISQEIRKAVVGDSSLSFKAKNVKITVGGKVTLRGPVKSTQERDTIEAAARKVAGVTQVDNQLEVSN
jgi:hyperosmotically inducible periplasmic protein